MATEEEKFKKLFGKKLRELRREKHLTQEQLAEMVELDTQHLCKMENGLHFPALKNLLKLAKILEINVVDFFVYDDPNEKDIIRKLKYSIQNNLNMKELIFLEQTVNALILMHSKEKRPFY